MFIRRAISTRVGAVELAVGRFTKSAHPDWPFEQSNLRLFMTKRELEVI